MSGEKTPTGGRDARPTHGSSLGEGRCGTNAAGPQSAPNVPEREFGLRIGQDGTWYYHDSPIRRAPMVKLFASVLWREADGSYWLVTPAERGRIAVEDVPFIAVAMEVEGGGRTQILSFRTNVDDRVEADESHPLRIVTDPRTGEPSPYLLVRPGLEARLARPVFYQLVDLGAEETIDGVPSFGVWSSGKFFPLSDPITAG
jgi:hypothetical protein